jgi:putative ABC transport system permease protein
MEYSYLVLSPWQVALAALLIVVNGAISAGLQLKMERTLAVAAVRTILQLLLIGMVLEWVFRVERAWVVLALLSIMTLVAGFTAVQRTPRRYPGIWWNALLSIWVSSWFVTAYAMMVVLSGVERWYQPQYAVPLMGMILGNTMNGVSLGLAALIDALLSQRERVETLLALGATRWEAASGPVRHAVRTGMIPLVNMMMVVGLVNLPGLMTGQILSGTRPIEAVKYQIVIMFLVASSAAMGTVGVVLLAYMRLFSRDHQFLVGRLEHPSPPRQTSGPR